MNQQVMNCAPAVIKITRALFTVWLIMTLNQIATSANRLQGQIMRLEHRLDSLEHRQSNIESKLMRVLEKSDV